MYQQNERPERAERESRQTNNSGSIFAKKKKSCPFTAQKMEELDYKDLEMLKQFITERGKIIPRRVTGVSHYYQNKLKKAIKRARHMALIPFVATE
jgi:small subunit ribosomal protein S18